MRKETVFRARNDAILNTALKQGRRDGISEQETYEKLVHYLLNIKDEVMQERYERLLYPQPLKWSEILKKAELFNMAKCVKK